MGHIIYKWWLLEDEGKGVVNIGAVPRSTQGRSRKRQAMPITVDDDMNITLITDEEGYAFPDVLGVVVGAYRHVGDDIEYIIAEEAYDWFEEFGT